MEQQKLKKDKGCIHCEKLFYCDGKPPEVDLCVNFKERRGDHVGQKHRKL